MVQKELGKELNSINGVLGNNANHYPIHRAEGNKIVAGKIVAGVVWFLKGDFSSRPGPTSRRKFKKRRLPEAARAQGGTIAVDTNVVVSAVF